jgi:hypothetical protein
MTKPYIKQYAFYFLYVITNKITNKIYVGVHATDNLDDGYLGSGIHIERAIKKYGAENFERTILRFFDNEVDMFKSEESMVTPEFVKEDTNYNIAPGGRGGNTGNYDSEERSELLRIAGLNKTMARDESGNIIKVDSDDVRFDTKELVGLTYGKTTVRDINGQVLQVSRDDPRIKTGELVGVTKGLAMMKDKNGTVIQVSVDDLRIKTGELVGVTSGSTQSKESNDKRSKKLKGRKVKHTYVSCILCKKSTILTNFLRWHKDCTTRVE